METNLPAYIHIRIKTAFIGVVAIALAAVLLCEAYFHFVTVPEDQVFQPERPQDQISLSDDRTEIIARGVKGREVLLTASDPAIFQFFKTQSQLCDAANIGISPERRLYCTDLSAFAKGTHFSSVVSSPVGRNIGFTIASDALRPDTAAGIFYPSRTGDKVVFFTNYYLGNEFLSFSPTGIYFVYKSDCFEGKCGITVRNTETLFEKIRLGGGEGEINHEFVRWISDQEFESKDGEELHPYRFE